MCGVYSVEWCKIKRITKKLQFKKESRDWFLQQKVRKQVTFYSVLKQSF